MGLYREVGSMAKKNSKPYNSLKKDRTINNKKNNSTNNNYNTKNFNTKSIKKIDKDLESTTRIRVDSLRLNDSETLDTSFLEGRVKNNKKKKERILTLKKDYSKLFKFFKNIFYLGGSFTLLILAFLIVRNKFLFDMSPKEKVDKVIEKKVENIIDDNYLFIGEGHTQNFDFDSFQLDYHYINMGDEDLLLEDLLSDLKKKVYDFNPSIIFVQVGMNDIIDGRSIDQVVQDLKSILLKIKENRPYAKIYVESIYPINKEVEDFDDDYKDINNYSIVTYNKQLEDLCESLDVYYLDVFSELSINNQLNKEYTDDGINLNDNGYKRLYKLIRKIVDEEK